MQVTRSTCLVRELVCVRLTRHTKYRRLLKCTVPTILTATQAKLRSSIENEAWLVALSARVVRIPELQRPTLNAVRRVLRAPLTVRVARLTLVLRRQVAVVPT